MAHQNTMPLLGSDTFNPSTNDDWSEDQGTANLRREVQLMGGEMNGEMNEDAPNREIYNNDMVMTTILNDTSSPTDQEDSPANMDPDNVWPVTTSPENPVACEKDSATGEATGDDSSDIPKYQLRPQTRELKAGFTSTWIDQDQTGDYDPSEENRKERLLRNRLKLRSRHSVRQAAERYNDNDADDEAPPKVRPNLKITLSIRSEASKIKFRELADSLPPKTEFNHEHTNGYHLRKRAPDMAFTYDDNYDAKKSRFAPDDGPADPTGHPFARGCWQCFTLGHECPLLADESNWPCAACEECDYSCKLVTEPTRKRACEWCKKRRIGCSYSYTLNHGAACQQCMDSGQCCVAGPAKDGIRTRIRYDRDWIAKPMPVKRPSKARKVLSCAECSKAELPCSFADTGNDGQACEACKTSDDPCTLEHLIPQQRNKAETLETGAKRKLDETDAAFPPSNKQAKVSDGCAGIHKTIETKLCHPIVFNCDEKGEGSCHFCEEAGYGILGMGMREVEVIDWTDGRGLDEISGGHKGDGIENTRICTHCTMSRMSIIMCAEHEMTPVAGLMKNATDENDALSELLSGDVRKRRRWCAICPSLAYYECRAPGDDGPYGCSLALCECCMLVLRGVHDGDLQKMLPKLKDEVTDQKMLGLRADYALLKENGLLMRYVLGSS